jgi:proline iminopeptidase
MGELTTTDGTRIRYEVRGEGPPVYVLQGGPNNVCDTLISDLAPLESDVTLVFHDYRGSGQSGNAPPETYTFVRMADDVAELRAHLGHGPVAILAHSMGGFIGLNYALRHPDGCARLALVGTTPTASFRALTLPTLRALGLARTAKAFALALRFVVLWSWRRKSPEKTMAMYAPNEVTQEPRRELRALVRAAHPNRPADNDNAAHLMRLLDGTDLRPDLGRITCPTLLLYGDRDAVMVAGGHMHAAAIPHAERHVLPAVGHEPFVEEPQQTFDLLRTFLTHA